MTKNLQVLGICPTFRRPKCLENVIACWIQQDYPRKARTLIIGDSAGEINEGFGVSWWLYHIERPKTGLGTQFNQIIKDNFPADIYMVVEDDDIYAPWHVSSHARAYAAAGNDKPLWCQSEQVYSLYSGKIEREGSDGRFHASLSLNRAMFEAIGGWVETDEENFDQQFIRRMKDCTPEPLRPLNENGQPDDPGYVMRWNSTGAYHGQHFMSSPKSRDWWHEVPKRVSPAPRDALYPETDTETSAIIKQLTAIRKHPGGWATWRSGTSGTT